jgi:hypothetical protein
MEIAIYNCLLQWDVEQSNNEVDFTLGIKKKLPFVALSTISQ